MPSNAKLLLIDNNEMYLKHLASYCASQLNPGWIETALDAKTALEMARINQPDLITLDLVMPGTNGFETLELLRKVVPDCWLIALSSLEKELYYHKALSHGADDFVEKSVITETLLPTLVAYLKNDTRSSAIPPSNG